MYSNFQAGKPALLKEDQVSDNRINNKANTFATVYIYKVLDGMALINRGKPEMVITDPKMILQK